MNFTESIVEEAALIWLEALGYAELHGPEIAADMPGAERSDRNYREVVLPQADRQRTAGENVCAGIMKGRKNRWPISI